MRKGLVLEGGAMRGLFTAGVMDVLMENRIVFDGAVGVSAGAVFGCNFKSEQKGRVLRYNLRYCGDKRYCSFRSLIKTGDMFGTDFCYRELPLELDVFDNKTYENNPMDFYVVCTDIEKGTPVYHNYKGFDDHGFDWLRASASMPLASQIVEIDGHKYLDGGISDSIPLEFMENSGYDKNVVILTQPENYRKSRNKALPFIKRKYSDYPKLVEAMEKRHIMYNREVKYVTKEKLEGKAFVIQPEKKLPVGRIEKNPDRLELVYKIGRHTAKKNLNSLKKFLET